MIQRADFGGFGDVAAAFNEQEPSNYHSPWIFDWLKELVGKHAEEAHILEVGCGTGTLVRHLAQAGFRMTIGTDPDPRMIAVAKKGTLEPCICAPTSDLPFPSATFDAVFVHYAFEHFCHDAGSVAEIRRVLREGGVLMTVTWPITGWNKRRNEIIRPFAIQRRVPLPYKHLAEVGYADLLPALGFKKVETRRHSVTIKYTIAQEPLELRSSFSPSGGVPSTRRALRG